MKIYRIIVFPKDNSTTTTTALFSAAESDLYLKHLPDHLAEDMSAEVELFKQIIDYLKENQGMFECNFKKFNMNLFAYSAEDKICVLAVSQDILLNDTTRLFAKILASKNARELQCLINNVESSLKTTAFEDSEFNLKNKQIQKNIEEIKQIMLQNIDKLIEEQGKLETLLHRTAELEAIANQFKFKADRLRNSQVWCGWFKNMLNDIYAAISYRFIPANTAPKLKTMQK